ncbi:histidine kinase [Natronococcus pandeyae]|uniref:histidine kinase n=1 Tax=Natronococcus pandeyae TaxID=2055836 RepID=A0A8J8Q614_9EURY|nr:ATP-binding protein [Natronococcus pandeyae]TYL40006.1 histidine kinase [Natronococcus pandeyae]
MNDSPRSDVDSVVHTRIRQQEIVAELGQQALETDDIDQLMHDAAVAVAETLDNEYAKVLELLPGGDEVFLRQGVGWRDGLVGNATVSTDSDSQAGYTLLSEEPIVVDDLRTEERFSGPELLTSHDVVSGISVIIGSVEEPWGVLGTHTTEKREFTEHDANFVQSVANVLASAIENTQTERRFRAIFEDPNILVGLLDPDGTVVNINQKAMEYVDADLSDVTGELFWETPWWGEGDEVQSDVKEWTKRAAAGEYVDFETDLTRPNGDRYTLNGYFRPVRDDDGDIVSIIVSDRDVTERKERERKLEMRERRFSTLMANVPGMVYRCKNERGWPMEFVSEACKELTGYDPQTLESGDIGWGKDVMIQEDRKKLWETVHQQAAKGEPFSETYRIKTADGDVRWVRDYGRSVVDNEEDVIGVEGIISDITDRKRLESELKERKRQLEESNERLEQFAYAASHDLQEPLRMVSSYLRLLDGRYGDEFDDEAEEFLEFAVDGADRMREMIDGLLEYSRVDTQGDPLEPVDLDRLFEEVQEDLQMRVEESNAEITTEDLPRVEGDDSQLRQVLQNLLDNAITYSGDEPPQIHVEADRNRRTWTVSVHDDGIGIDPDDQERVFEVFQRLQSREEDSGTGIGLALCQRIVERHGGRIWIDSGPGEGATFSFTLPAVDES